MVCPRPESCDAPRALMSIAPNLCCDETKNRGTYTRVTGWDGWMASLTQWMWVWVNSASWWWTGRPGVLRFMGSQRVGHDWVTELNWTELKTKTVSVSTFSPYICHEVMRRDAMILVFLMLSFKPALSLSSFTFTKMLFSSSSLSPIMMVSSAYLRLLIFLPAILIPSDA